MEIKEKINLKLQTLKQDIYPIKISPLSTFAQLTKQIKTERKLNIGVFIYAGHRVEKLESTLESHNVKNGDKIVIVESKEKPKKKEMKMNGKRDRTKNKKKKRKNEKK